MLHGDDGQNRRDEAKGAGTRKNTVSQSQSESAVNAAKILVEDAPSVYLFDVELPVFMRNELKGFVINPSYPRVPFFYDMYKE